MGNDEAPYRDCGRVTWLVAEAFGVILSAAEEDGSIHRGWDVLIF